MIVELLKKDGMLTLDFVEKSLCKRRESSGSIYIKCFLNGLKSKYGLIIASHRKAPRYAHLVVEVQIVHTWIVIKAKEQCAMCEYNNMRTVIREE